MAGSVLALGTPLVGVLTGVLGFMVTVAGAGLFGLGSTPRAGDDAGNGVARPGSTKRSRMQERLRHRFDHPDE